MSELKSADRVESVCAKRSWVMSTLTDDERFRQSDELPQAMRLHLSHCESCRMLADRLRAISSALLDAACVEPPDQLLVLAQSRARESIARGAAFTGRVDVSDFDDLHDDEWHCPRIPWRPLRYAAAAIVLVAGTSVWIANQPNSSRPLVAGPDSWDPGVSRVHEAPKNLVSKQIGESTVVTPDEAVVSPRIVNSITANPPAIHRDRARSGCRHDSLVDWAYCENPNCIHGIRPHSARNQRTVGWNADVDQPPGNTDEPLLLGHEGQRNR